MDSLEIYGLVTAAVGGVCALVSTLMPAPNPTSGVLYRACYKIINWAGCNWGKSKNADEIPRL